MHAKILLEAGTALLQRVLRFEHPADAVVAEYFREQRRAHAFGPRERAMLRDAIYTVLRKKTELEALAQGGSGPQARRLVILGFASTRDSIQAALGEAEKNWLRICDASLTGTDASPNNLPPWLAHGLQAQLGDEFPPLCNSLEQMAPLDLRVNTLKQSREVLQRQLAQAGCESAPTPYSPWGLRVSGKPALHTLQGIEPGAYEVQDEGSQLLALLLGARRGEMVADFCAGTGGKTLALGTMMRNTGRLYALDTSAHRLSALAPRLAHSGLSHVYPMAIAHEHDARIKPLSGKLDRVLVDAPCSGLGTLRRQPDLKWRQNPQTVAAYAQGQAKILAAAADLLKLGGRLVYATCSLMQQENEEIAAAFSAQHPGFEPLSCAQILAGLKVAAAPDLCSGLYLRLWPHRHGTDGFFAAAWHRRV